MEVREIAAAATGHQDLLAHPVGTLQNDDAAAALARNHGAHQPGGSAADYDNVEI